MSPETALIQLHAWAQEELAAQAALLVALERMDEAAREASAETLARAIDELEAAAGGEAARAARRARPVGALAAHFGVAADTLTLGSILERADAAGLGDAGVRDALRAARAELGDRACEVSRRARRMSASAAQQRGLLRDLLAILCPGEAPVAAGGGALVDAEA